MEIDYVALGKRIKHIRKKRKISQEQLAGWVNVSVPHMSNIENGKTKFSLQVLVDLAGALQVTPDALLFEQVEARGKVRGVVLSEIDRLLSDCTEAQISVIEEMVRSTKSVLKQYDKQIREIKKEKTEI